MANTLPEGFVIDPVNDSSAALPQGFTADAPPPASPTNIDALNTDGASALSAVLEQSNLIPSAQKAAFQRGMAQGATFGFADEASALIRTGVDEIAAFLTGRDTGEDNYSRRRDISRTADEKLKTLYPNTYLAGEVGGSLIGGSAGAPKAGATFLKNLGQLAKVGAAEGAVAGLGTSEADLTEGEFVDAAVDTATGAAIGAVGSAALGGAADVALRGISRIPLKTTQRLQGTVAQRGKNRLTDYFQEEVRAGRINPAQLQDEVARLRAGAADGVNISLADLDELQAFSAALNQQAGRPRNVTEEIGDVRLSDEPLTDSLQNRVGTQQQAIADRVAPEGVVGGTAAVDSAEGLVETVPQPKKPHLKLKNDGTYEVLGTTDRARPLREGEVTPNVDSELEMASTTTATSVEARYDPYYDQVIEDVELTTITEPTGDVIHTINSSRGELNIPAITNNLKQDLTQASDAFYDVAYQTPVKLNQLSKDLRDTPSFQSAYKAGTVAAKNNTRKPSEFQKLDYTKRELAKMITAARGGEKRDLVRTQEALTNALRDKSPAYADALDVQTSFRKEVINQYANAPKYFDMDATAAANAYEGVASGNLTVARDAIGDSIRRKIETGVRGEDGRLLNQQQTLNYERLLDGENLGKGMLRNMINTEARLARTKKITDITSGKGIGAEAEQQLQAVLGSDDLAASTIITAMSNPSMVALNWAISRGIGSNSAKSLQQKVIRQMQDTMYSELRGSDAEVAKHIDNLFSMQFAKVPEDVIRQFINTFIVGTTGEPLQRVQQEQR